MLRSPSVGPIVGHTTHDSVRLWIRASDESPGRSVGIAALYDANSRYLANSVQYFRLHREYDRTGAADFHGLNPDTLYRGRLASLTLDSTDDMVRVEDDDFFAKLPKPDVWLAELEKLPDPETTAQFTTFPVGRLDDLSFLFGSCRYPGLLWAAKSADRIFGAMLEKLRDAAVPRFLLMVGDQIYADKMNRLIPLERADTPSEFHDRYVTAFSSPNMHDLLRSVPSYMILDDHEIEDNWVQSRIEIQEKRILFQTAISAYMSYQWVHGPRNYDQAGVNKDNFGSKLYYSFECAGYPFFAMDSRTQRIKKEKDDVLEDNHLLGYPSKPSAGALKGQIDILCDWLAAQQALYGGRPKFVVSPSVFVPNGVDTAGPPKDDRANRGKCQNDSWAAFPVTRQQLLKAIVDGNVQNVVFLSGDVHCSNIAEMAFVRKSKGKAKDGDTPLPLRAFSITSSAFYWPWSFADGDPLSFVHDSTAEGDDFQIDGDVWMTYRAYAFEQEDNFTRVDVSTKEIVIQNYGKDGKALGGRRMIEME